MTTEEAEFSGQEIMRQLEQRRADQRKNWNRNVFGVRTNDDLASLIREHCKSNNLSINSFLNNLLKDFLIMADFNPALSLPIKWSIGEDRFNDDDDAKVLTLTIPVDSLDQFIDHLKALSYTKQKQGEVYDFKKKEKVKTQCIYVNAKGMDGQYGLFGNINPQKIEDVPTTDELPF